MFLMYSVRVIYDRTNNLRFSVSFVTLIKMDQTPGGQPFVSSGARDFSTRSTQDPPNVKATFEG
jgi:hypothetical protein